MDEVTPISARKSDHIRINLDEDVQSGITTGLEDYHFLHRAIPELNLQDVDTKVRLFNKVLDSPILISSMTGGTDKAAEINHRLATAAETTNIAMGVGSQRIALEDQSISNTFKVRSFAPNILLFANLGAIQLNYGYGIDECLRAVEMIEADALILHFNSLQEALQKDGQTQFAGLINHIEMVCKSIAVPVIAKEVGWGFSKEDVRLLQDAGISAIDIAGAGGTSWSQVEMHRAAEEHQRQLASAFVDWGIPTVEVIKNVKYSAPSLPIIASGGLRSGVDIAKCIALGATIGGMAGPFLKAAASSVEDIIDLITLYSEQIKICMFATGTRSIDLLNQNKIYKHD